MSKLSPNLSQNQLIMRILKTFGGIAVLCFLIVWAAVQFSACTKTITVTDTIHDTTIVIVRDTVVITDSIYDLTDGLIAYYNFNGGNLNDSSGYGNNIIFNNATPTADRFGNPNNAYLFDSSTSYMKVANNTILNPLNITMMAIVKFTSFDTGKCFISQILMKGSQDPDPGVYGLRVVQANGACGTQLDTTSQKFAGTFGDNGQSASILDNTHLIHTGTWVTVVYTYDGRTSKIYINGQLDASNPSTAQFSPNNFDIYIGKTQNPTFPYNFSGAIDEIRIYNRALGPQAVKQLSNQTK